MAVFYSPVGNTQFEDVNGNPANAYTITTYLAGTTTPAATYTSNTGLTAQANPITLNTLGLPANPIWLTGGVSMKFVFKDVGGATVWTIDNVTGINDATSGGITSEWVSASYAPTFISGTSFSVVGDKTQELQVNRRIKSTNTGGTVYSSILTSVYSAPNTTITVLNTLGTLDSGMTALSYGLLSANNPSYPVQPASTNLSGVQTINGGQFGGFRNTLINPKFDINQSGVAGSITLTANQHWFDGWRAGSGGATVAISVVSGQHSSVTITAGTLLQNCEADNFTGSYCLSWVGTSQARYASDAGFDSYAASGKVCNKVAGYGHTVEFNTGTLKTPQLEQGITPTIFEQLATEFDLIRCQRRFRVIVSATGTASSATQAVFQIMHDGMRVTPTVSASAALTCYNYLNSTFTQSSANISIVSNSANGGRYMAGNYTGLGAPTQFDLGTTGGKIFLDSRL